MVNKTTFKQYMLEAEEKMPRAKSQEDLLDSIKSGYFTKDGSKLKVKDFHCNYNQLKSLEGCPQTVGGSFYCDHNQLKSLEGCPQTVGSDFGCNSNQLESLEGCPQTVGGYFWCSSNQLESLEGCPQTVGGDFNCWNNKLKSLEGCPQTVGGSFWCYNNKKLTSLARINFYVHEINGADGADFSGCPIKSNVLGILKIRGLKKVKFDDKKLEEIMNKYLPMGNIAECMDELLDAGFSKEYCKW